MVSVKSNNLQSKLKSKQKKRQLIDNSKTNGSDDKPEKKNNKVQLIAQEIKFAKFLAGNDPKLSEKQLRKFKKWLKIRSNSSFPFQDQDFLRIWKGLFYCMWMSDKPLIQEQLADDLSSLIDCFDSVKVSIQFFKIFLQTMNTEWFGIDQWRIDKFMMLVRRMLRQILKKLIGFHKQKEIIQLFADSVEDTVLQSNMSMGFFMHFTEIYFEEVAKIFEDKVRISTVSILVKPFATFIAKSKDIKSSKYVIRHVFHYLLFQSELGRQFQDKFDAWKHMGFPGKSIDDIELAEQEDEINENVEDDEVMDYEESNESKPLDPRAGQVNVEMPELKFDPIDVVKIFESLRNKEFTNVKSRKLIKKLILQFTLFSKGKFPLGIRRMEINDKIVEMPSIDDKVNQLRQFENKLLGNTKELKRLSKKKRKRSIMQETTKVSPKKNNQNRKKIEKIKVLLKEHRKKINDWAESDVSTVSTNVMNHENELIPSLNTSSIETNDLSTTNTSNATLNNSDLVINPAALKRGKHLLKNKILSAPATPTGSKGKRVKIMLKLNSSQDTSDYIKQIRNSPSLPYDSTKKPLKSLLKPNLLPSPINPYYKKKIGFEL